MSALAETIPARSHPLWWGCLAGLASACVGSAWQVLSRHAVTTSLGPLELALLRYLIPALVMLPVTWRAGLVPASVGGRRVLVLVALGGLPFLLMVLSGARFAPVAHMGVMLSGAVPLFTSLLAWVLGKERMAPMRFLGLGCILAGVLAIGAASLKAGGSSSWIGDLLFLGAALMWAAYGLVFRGSGLSPWQGVAIVNTWSALLVLPIAAVAGLHALAAAPLHDLLLQALMQGLVAGVLGSAVYKVSIKYLGAPAAASFAALTPVLSAAGGALFLGEALSLPTALAALLTALGVLLVSGALGLVVRR